MVKVASTEVIAFSRLLSFKLRIRLLNLIKSYIFLLYELFNYLKKQVDLGLNMILVNQIFKDNGLEFLKISLPSTK